MTKEANTKRVKIKQPTGLVYYGLVPLGRLLLKLFFNVKRQFTPEVKALKKSDRPVVAIGTHTSAMDFMLMMTALMPKRLNVVCGRDLLAWKPIRPIAKGAGLIPISQFALDFGSVRHMKRAVQDGCSLSLFPEGKISLDGKPLHFFGKGTAKLLKLLDADVVMVHNNGGYQSRPRWFSLFKRGKIVTDVKVLFTKEELKAMTKDAVHERLLQAFKFNDNIYQQENGIRYKTRTPAKNLNYILYKCPRCGAEYEMRTTNTQIICDKCNNTVRYDEFGRFIPDENSITFDRIDTWYNYQRESVRAEISQPNFIISKQVVWEKQPTPLDPREPAGEGELYIDDKVIGFKGVDINGAPAEVSMPLNLHPAIVQKFNEGIDLTIDNCINRFYFKEAKYSSKYNLIVEEQFRKIHNLPPVE